MPSLKDVKVKIAGVKKTKQITKAMNMVASANVRGAQQRIERFRPIAAKFIDMLGDLASKADSSVHPASGSARGNQDVWDRPRHLGPRAVRQLHSNLITTALKLGRQEGRGRQERSSSTAWARKAAMRPARPTTRSPWRLPTRWAASTSSSPTGFGLDVINAYLARELDEVIMVYGEFVSMAKQLPIALPILPIAPKEEEAAPAAPASNKEYIYEPAVEGLLAELLPRFIKVQLYRGLLDTSASEHAARMAAMDNATRTCDDMIGSLTLLFNKTRQASITRDLMDIVGGAEALKG
uniref:F1F0-ATPase gamma subunit n=2 Tax=Nitratidesulfovibrio vulgaris TaxID=881 RepID=Q9S5B6_NITVL|nr:F1F0-ATPase gamma subunit [Desulfovibrio vulgaris] [Nitratidesulfovibrio vulgaris str. 'Miyazaki F']